MKYLYQVKLRNGNTIDISSSIEKLTDLILAVEKYYGKEVYSAEYKGILSEIE